MAEAQEAWDPRTDALHGPFGGSFGEGPARLVTVGHVTRVCGRPLQPARAGSPDTMSTQIGAAFNHWLAAAAAARARSLEARLDRLEGENATLREQLTAVARRLDAVEAAAQAEMEDYLERERKLMEWANTLPEPPDYGTDDPWQIARMAGERLGPDEIDRLFGDD